MKNKKIFLILVIIFIIIAALAFIQSRNSQPSMILFYGDTCPHCQIVKQYITDNNITARFNFQELEVYQNKTNASLLGKYAHQCGLDTTQGVGVPFFFDGQKCIMGDQDIITYFKEH
ncbi:MAG: hypothetical protein WC249_04360 [Patescibacteria group bacterium]|jgi:glutaredoxin